jgi:hypothetical protein
MHIKVSSYFRVHHSFKLIPLLQMMTMTRCPVGVSCTVLTVTLPFLLTSVAIAELAPVQLDHTAALRGVALADIPQDHRACTKNRTHAHVSVQADRDRERERYILHTMTEKQNTFRGANRHTHTNRPVEVPQ